MPIIRGATVEDVKALAPSDSYINVDSFKNLEEMVEYIHYLDQNDEAYMTYFKWRKELNRNIDVDGKTVPKHWPSKLLFRETTFGFCDLCNAINTNRLGNTTTIPSLHAWWYGTENKDCFA